MRREVRIAPALAALAIAASCAGGAGGTASPIGPTATVATATDQSASGSLRATGAPSASAAAWQLMELTDVRTGASARIADFAGRVVVMELMATWCPPCLTQQGEKEIASRQLDPERVAFVTVDADSRESAATVRAYADRHGFDWTYAVATPALLRALADEYGIGVLDPPATPIVIVATDGSARLVEVGIKPAARLVELARAAGA